MTLQSACHSLLQKAWCALGLDSFFEELKKRRATKIFVYASTGPVGDSHDPKESGISNRLVGPSTEF
jgi:hypothetical protein